MDHDDYAALRRSPYASMYEIYFQGKRPLHIYEKVFDKCPKLSLFLTHSNNGVKTVNLRDIPYDAGHIVIHFLVAKGYQGLRPRGSTEEERNASELATAFRPYAAAVDLDLPSLQELTFIEPSGSEATNTNGQKSVSGEASSSQRNQLPEKDQDRLSTLQRATAQLSKGQVVDEDEMDSLVQDLRQEIAERQKLLDQMAKGQGRIQLGGLHKRVAALALGPNATVSEPSLATREDLSISSYGEQLLANISASSLSLVE
ncbi:hypothetical protein FSARC_4848 [Fusarium sarcochroum]|uniref:Uncharacterized protein n=1 Tax=Fusarium sarcochroum TaxID=1208366 RepID=A0A8H4XA67_9HYPO|nr:hypothetical protein FSARC_4848 [Fusarium sarcochroum]